MHAAAYVMKTLEWSVKTLGHEFDWALYLFKHKQSSMHNMKTRTYKSWNRKVKKIIGYPVSRQGFTPEITKWTLILSYNVSKKLHTFKG